MQALVSLVTKAPQKFKEDDDFVDRLHHRYTTILLVVFAVVVSAQIYYGSPITCWSPSNFHKSHIKFATSLCWVNNTYFLPLEEEIPQEGEKAKRDGEILYYQWMPFVFLVMAIGFYAPSIVWHGLNSKSGVDADNILESANSFSNSEKIESRDKLLRLITNQFHRFLGSPRIRAGWRFSMRQAFTAMCCICGKKFGNYLTILYLFVKLLYIGNVFMQLFVLNSFLKTSYNIYGFEAIGNLIDDALDETPWFNSTVFPKVTMCDIHIRILGNVQRHTLQCLLPINMYTEKIFVVLWFWMVFVLFMTVVSLLMWTIRAALTNDRLRYIENHLVVSDRIRDDSDHDHGLAGLFVCEYLRQDGVFVLRMIGHNTNGITTSEIIGSLWDDWLERRTPPRTTAHPKGGLGSSDDDLSPLTEQKRPPTFPKPSPPMKPSYPMKPLNNFGNRPNQPPPLKPAGFAPYALDAPPPNSPPPSAPPPGYT